MIVEVGQRSPHLVCKNIGMEARYRSIWVTDFNSKVVCGMKRSKSISTALLIPNSKDLISEKIAITVFAIDDLWNIPIDPVPKRGPKVVPNRLRNLYRSVFLHRDHRLKVTNSLFGMYRNDRYEDERNQGKKSEK